jgi:hypothetical protein
MLMGFLQWGLTRGRRSTALVTARHQLRNGHPRGDFIALQAGSAAHDQIQAGGEPIGVERGPGVRQRFTGYAPPEPGRVGVGVRRHGQPQLGLGPAGPVSATPVR